jgi:hypothetical protein
MYPTLSYIVPGGFYGFPPLCPILFSLDPSMTKHEIEFRPTGICSGEFRWDTQWRSVVLGDQLRDSWTIYNLLLDALSEVIRFISAYELVAFSFFHSVNLGRPFTIR